MVSKSRCAVVTPYFREEKAVLARCLDSVAAQTIAADHIVVADGHPQDWVDQRRVRHMRLDRSHGDNGNTPRAIGAMLAAAEGYRAICFLDADNWLDANHCETCLDAGAQAGGPYDYVIARRRLVRMDGSPLALEEEPGLVDTGCLFFLPPSYYTLPRWGMMPSILSPVCDRVFWRHLQSQPLRGARVALKTVNFYCSYQAFYRAVGEDPPPSAKPSANVSPMRRWVETLPEAEREQVSRRVGFDLTPQFFDR